MLDFLKTNKDIEKTNKTYLFVNSTFYLSSLQSIIEDAFETSKTTIDKLSITTNSITIDFNVKEEKDIISSSRFRFLKKESVIHVFSESVELSQQDYKETVVSSKINLKKDAIFKYIQNHIIENQDDSLYALENKENISFVQDSNSIVKNYIYHQLKDQEYVLAVLNISRITFKEDIKISKNTSWQFVLTSLRTLLIGTSDDDFTTLDISNEKIIIQEKTGKDSVSGASFTFLTELLNDTDYVSIYPAITTSKYRLDVFSDCLLKKYNSKTKYLELASKIYHIQHQQSGLQFYKLKSDLIKYLEGFKLDKKQKETITEVLQRYSTDSSNFGDFLIKICNSWRLNYDTQYGFLEIIYQNLDALSTKNSISYLKYFNPIFLKKQPKEEAVFEFNLNYAKALTKSELYIEAITVYKALYDTLPDDSIGNLIPTNKTNILKGEGDQQLKISILESTLNCENKAKQDRSQTLLKLAQLQPLSASRITALRDTENYNNKADTITKAINFKYTKHEVTDYKDASYDKLVKNEVLEDIVPQCFKNSTGFFDSLNSYIATINQPDYSAVISFSDKLSETNYPNIHKDITNICFALNIDTPECYIGRADYANSIIGIEGKPPYLIIGINFIEPSRTTLLTHNELKFLIAIELAHIYFEHSKITSNDVWRGAAEKGFSIVTVVLTLLPFAGSLGPILGNLTNVDRYAKIVNSVEKASNVAEKGQNILDAGEKLNINLLNKSDDTGKPQDLLITSRLMEIIADKLALLFCNDLQAAIKSIVISSAIFEKDIPNIEKYGLYKVLARTNENDEFYYQETIIRIKSLCAFYLTDTYDSLRVKLHSGL